MNKCVLYKGKKFVQRFDKDKVIMTEDFKQAKIFKYEDARAQLGHGYNIMLMPDGTCISCGDPVPEGRLICGFCEGRQ